MSRITFLQKMGMVGRLSLGVLALLAVASVASIPLVTAWSGDPTLNTLICAAAGDQGLPVVVGDGYSGTIFVWQDHRGGTEWDIYAQRADPAGGVQWPGDGIAICTASSDQVSPAAASDGQGGAIIAWQDSRDGNCDVYAQRVGSAGVALWTANGVPICTASYDQISPLLVSDGSGGAIVIWQDKRNGSDHNIYAQKVDASGKTQWTANGVTICQAAADQMSVTAVGDSDGGAIIAWQDTRNGNYDIYAQRVDSSCAPLWTTNGVGICTLAGPQISPVIVSDTSGGAIIVWSDGRSGTDCDIYSQRVNSGGSAQWTLNGVLICAAGGDQVSPSAAGDGDGGAIIAWQDSRGSTNYDIYTQRVKSTGHTQWTTNGAPVCTAAEDQRSPLVVSGSSSGAIIAWQDARGNTDYDIYGQSVDSAGSAQWSVDGVPICTAAEDQGSLTVASDGSGGAIVAWEDSRGADKDVYTQRVQASGALSSPPDQPGNLSPADGESGVEVTPTLKSSAFSSSEPGDSHAASQWRITTAAGDYSNPVFDSGADSFGLRQVTVDSGRLTGNAVYYWQVRHQGTNSLWSPWSVETSFTTRNRAPDQPEGVWPQEGTVGIALTPTLQSSPFSDPDIGDGHATSQWRITTTSGDYSNPAFLTPELASSLVQATVDSGCLTSNTTYYWQVRHKDLQGGWSAWSDEKSFTTLNQPPDRPAAVSPPAGATGISLSATLESSAFSDPDSGDTHAASQWQIAASPGEYGSPVFDSSHGVGSGLTSTVISSGNLNPGTTYYWRVRYQDSRGAWSEWSEESSFTTQSTPEDSTENRPPDRPVCVSPENGADDVSTTPTLESSAFHDPDTGDAQAASQWQITAKAGDYEDPAVDRLDRLSSMGFPSQALSPDTTYYWRVRHQDAHGAWSEWSEESSFTTKAGEPTGVTNRTNAASWLYLAGIAAVAVLAAAAVFWRNSRAARMATQ
jgi:hypothetical protein